MKFNINNYTNDHCAMHCKNQAELESFIEYLHNNGYDHLVPYHNGSCYYGKNLYYFNNQTWSSVAYAKENGYQILEWSEIMARETEFTKADLKTGDVILRRNGSVEIVNRELEMFIRKKYYGDLDKIKDNLTSYSTPELDIIAVRRPVDKADCCFDAFKNNWGTLVYERKEPEEMTLAEVCKLLGKEIKIIP
jgi:hypothetical protein